MMIDKETSLELRMYFFVPYNISPIQQAIQAGHSMGEYALEYGRHDPNHIIWDFLEEWKTWIVLNGGTTNENMMALGSLQLAVESMNDFNSEFPNEEIEWAEFYEPDLNDALTAVCFIIDERVFNYEDYPDWEAYQEDYYKESDGHSDMDIEDLRKQWIGTLGGERNVFLRNLLKGKRLA